MGMPLLGVLMMMVAQSLSITNLTVKYGKTTAVDHLSCQIHSGDLLAIVGPNGGGKSSFLKALVSLIPHKGKIKSSTQKMAYLPQQTEIDRTIPLLVEEFISFGLIPSVGFWKSISSRHQIDQALATVGLKGYAKASLSELSGGQFQRVLFARLLLQDADTILLDEPFSAIDRQTTQTLMEIIQTLHSKGKTIITVLHDYTLVRQYFPKTLIIARKLIELGETSRTLTEENLGAAFHIASEWEGVDMSSHFIEPFDYKKSA